jgi:hypothetical protein
MPTHKEQLQKIWRQYEEAGQPFRPQHIRLRRGQSVRNYGSHIPAILFVNVLRSWLTHIARNILPILRGSAFGPNTLPA